jgi:hypothetical protein
MLEFPYMPVPFKDGVLYRPIVTFTIEGPSGTRNLDLLVDSGADSILLDTELARRIGVQLDEEPEGYTRSVSGDEIPYFGGRVIIELRRPPDIVRWPAQVAFADNPARDLFGQREGLAYFHAHFLGPERRLMLEPQSTLPSV